MTSQATREVRDVTRLELCAAVPLDLGAGTDAPLWVNIIPLANNPDGRMTARDGREFILDDPAGFVAASNAEIAKCGPQPVDKDHEMHSWLRGGGPALGWAEQYELRADGVYAKTDWLPDGAELITSKKYRYTSSNIRCETVNEVRDRWGFLDSYDLRMKSLAGFTITNIPALEVSAMFSTHNRNNAMDISAMLALVGLPATASREDFGTALSALKARAETAAADPSLDKFVPRADHDAVKAHLAELEAQLAKQTKDAAAAEIEQLLSEALKSGQVLPATADYHRKAMAQLGGVDNFREFVKTAPSLGGAVSRLAKQPAATGSALTDAELDICAQMNIQPAKFLEARAARTKTT